MYEIKKMITQYNQSQSLLKSIGGIQHSTGNGEDTAIVNQIYFNTGNRDSNAHFFIDADSIIQTVELDKQAWHARIPANKIFWGIEMCETRNATKFKQIWDRTVWLWAYLFTQVANPRILQVSINNLRSHDEENKINHKGDSSNHTDPTGYFAKFNKTMNDLRNDVQIAIDNIIIEEKLSMFKDKDQIFDYAKESVKHIVDLGIMKGSSDGNLYPQNPITRQDVAVLLSNLLKLLGK